MRIFSAIHTFDFPWSEVSTANWRKYCPWNKETEHVIAVDVLSRNLIGETGILRTERLITCKQAAPRWIQPFLGGAETSYVYEVSYVTPPHASSSTSSRQSSVSSLFSSASSTSQSDVVYQTPDTDPIKQSIPINGPPRVIMTSQNMTWSDLLSVREMVIYAPDAVEPQRKTRFEQHAQITAACGWKKINDKIEEFTMDRFGQNADKGRRGFQEVLEMSRKVFQVEKDKERQEATA